MLRSLYIQNYALIEKLDIGFETGFSVITGETGAGKSIILGAIGLLLGQRADVKAIRRGASKCIIEARFDISAYGMRPFFEENELEYDDEECILRREVQASGKSRAFINDTPASLAQVKELGEQLMPIGMLVTLDAIYNRVIQNWKRGHRTWIFCDEFYILFRYEYSANFFYKLWKRIRKYNGLITGMTQNVDELLRSDTARLMLANSEFLIMLNQSATDREELAKLLNISDTQLGYITNVPAGCGLIRCAGNLVPFTNSFPRNTQLYRLMTTKPDEQLKG